MELNEPIEGHENASVSLKVILLVFCLVLIGALSYFVYVSNSTSDSSDYSAPSVKNKTAAEDSGSKEAEETASWKTYINTNYSYSVKYSPEWAYREFPGSKGGAGFRLASTEEDPSNELISIGIMSRGEDKQTAFAEYVKTAAINEIQGYEKLLTNEKVTTASGVVGYKTTWQYRDLSGTVKTSGPIVYFPMKDGSNDGTIQLTSNVQSTPLTAEQLKVFNSMVTTFAFTK